MPDVGYYTLPVFLSFDGVDKQVNSSLGSSLKVAGTKGGKDFGQAFVKAASDADVKKLGDQYSRMYDKAADAADKLKVAQAGVKDLVDKGITSGKRYEAAIASRNKATRDEARSVRETADAYKDLEHAQSNVGKGGTSAGHEAASGFLDGFGGPLEALGSKAGPIGAALASAAALGVGAGALLAKEVMAGVEQEAAADKIQARFGLDEATMTKFGQAGGEAYAANFGDSITGNVEAAAVALQNGLLPKDATETQTKDVVAQLSTVSTVLGVDIPEAARSAGQLMKTGFAKDFSQAADLIVAGSQSGLNVSQDWLDTVNEYSTQFRKLGVSGPEALGLLSQAVKGGARDTDVAADALKEFSIRAVDGSKTTVDGFTKVGLSADDMAVKFAAGGPAAHDALQQVLVGLRNIQDPAERSRVAVELFGTQAEDLGGALSAFDLSTATQQLGNVEGAAQKASDVLGGNTASGIESAKRQIDLAISNTQKSLADAFGPEINQATAWVSSHQAEIVSFFTGVAEGATVMTGAIIGAAGQVLVGFGNIDAAIGDGVGFIIDSFETITGAAATVAGAFGATGLAKELHDAQGRMGELSDTFHSAGEDLIATGHGMDELGTSIIHTGQEFGQTGTSAGNAAAQIAHVKDQMANLPDGKNIDIHAIVRFTDQNGKYIDPSQLITPSFTAAVPGETRRPLGGGRAKGGVLPGYSPGVDNMLVPMSGGEGVIVPQVMRKLGPAWLANLNRTGGYAGGGVVGADALYAEAQSLLGRKYSMESGDDCSGTMSQLVNAALGLAPKTDRMSTATAAQWLAKKGALPGLGPNGTFRLGWKNGGPGGGHMAGTLPDGTHVEMGGANGGYTLGGNAKGADDPEFTDHAYLPMEALYPDGMPSGGAATPYGAGGVAGGGTPGTGPNGESGTYTVDQRDVAEKQGAVREADAKVAEAEAKLRELKADAKESEKISTQNDLVKAKNDAQKARDDLADAQKGKFTASGKGGKGGSSDLSELGSIAKSFITETFGIDGSWLPDIGNLAPVKMLDTLLGAFLPGGGGGLDSALSGASATSSAPFGMPDVAAPIGTPASGVGLGPAPGPTINVDGSTNIAGNVGWDKSELDKERDRNLHRAVARVPVGA